MNEPIYLDYNATTPLASEVAVAMLPYLEGVFGNPSSLHWAGGPARDAVEAARSQVASLLCCDATEIVFTSGGTEANNLAVKGVLFSEFAKAADRPHFVTSQIEHPAVLEPCRFAQRLGADVTLVPVDRHGLVDPDEVRLAIQPTTVLVSVMHANNEVGLQHVMFHAVPLFWRLHMVHHADLDFDVTTGLRFHTLEIFLSFGIKAAAILLLGAPALAVLIFEVLLNATSMFNHSNVQMPAVVDGDLRWLVVTPDMHRVHHSHRAQETNSNFGFNLPWWDRLLGTYRDQPAEGHAHMAIGLTQFPDERRTERLPWMLWLPFAGETGDYPINRQQSVPDLESPFDGSPNDNNSLTRETSANS